MICVKARLMAFAQKHSVTSFRFEFVANSFIIDPMCSHEKHIFCIAECCCLVATEMLFPVWKLDAPTNLSFFFVNSLYITLHRVKTGKKREQKWTYQFYCAWRHTTDVCLVCMWLPNVLPFKLHEVFMHKYGAPFPLCAESHRKYQKPRED